jgi:hypothetical protein
MYWRSETVTVNRDLSTKMVIHGEYGDKVLATATGKITQAQFDSLVQALNKADFSHAKSTPLDPMPVGGGNDSVTVRTATAKFEIVGPSYSVFPAGFSEIFEARGPYQPNIIEAAVP